MVAPSSPSEKPRWRLSLLALFFVLTLLSVWFALGATWGGHELILPLDVLVVGWGLASIMGMQRLCGRSIPKLTFGEFLVLCVLCCVLHGLAMPPISP